MAGRPIVAAKRAATAAGSGMPRSDLGEAISRRKTAGAPSATSGSSFTYSAKKPHGRSLDEDCGFIFQRRNPKPAVMVVASDPRATTKKTTSSSTPQPEQIQKNEGNGTKSRMVALRRRKSSIGGLMAGSASAVRRQSSFGITVSQSTRIMLLSHTFVSCRVASRYSQDSRLSQAPAPRTTWSDQDATIVGVGGAEMYTSRKGSWSPTR